MDKRANPAGPQVLGQVLELSSWLAEAMHADAAGRGLTVARAEVVWVLSQRGPIRQRDLAESLRVTPRNVTILLDALQAAGLIRRSPHPRDRRAVLVELTETGRAAAEALVADQDEFARFLFDGLPPSELAAFSTTLDTILERLRGPGFTKIREEALDRWSVQGTEREAAAATHVPVANRSPRRHDRAASRGQPDQRRA